MFGSPSSSQKQGPGHDPEKGETGPTAGQFSLVRSYQLPASSFNDSPRDSVSFLSRADLASMYPFSLPWF